MVFNRWRIPILVSALFLFPLSISTSAQTTQPAPEEWTQLVDTVARGFTGDLSASSGLTAAVPDDVPIRHFGISEIESRTKMQQQTDGLKVLAARSYTWPGLNIATDLAADLRSVDGVPDAIRRQFTPRDEADVKRANNVAKLWVESVLRPSQGQVVAVVILWEVPPPVTAAMLLGGMSTREVKQPYVVLIKGMKTEDGQYHVTQIAYGDVTQASN